MSAASDATAFISLNGSRTGVPRGTAVPSLGGNCTVVVKKVAPSIEGSFTATVIGLLDAKHMVTAGYFYFTDGSATASWPASSR